MSTREPSAAAIIAARIAKAYPSLSAYSAASLADELCRIERAQHRHAERCCSGADGGYVRKRDFAKIAVFDGKAPRGTTEWRKDSSGRWEVEHDPAAEKRAARRVERRIERWCLNLAECRHPHLVGDARSMAIATAACMHRAVVTTQGDPRGAVLLVRFPGETEARWA